MTVSIERRCDNCRGTSISNPLDGGDDSPVDCEDCGADLGTLGDIKTLLSLQMLGRKNATPRAFMLLH